MPTLDVDDPYTVETALHVELADNERVNDVLDRARAAFAKFRGTSVEERIALCERATVAMESAPRTIARDITRQMGKPLAQGAARSTGMARRARHMMAIAEESLADIVLPEGRASSGASRRSRSASSSICRRGTTRCSPR